MGGVQGEEWGITNNERESEGRGVACRGLQRHWENSGGLWVVHVSKESIQGEEWGITNNVVAFLPITFDRLPLR